MITLVLMASGYGKRFGSNKLFYEIGGKAMYLHILEKLHCLSEKKMDRHILRVVVITQYPEIMETAERLGIEAVFNGEAAEGIAASVRLGVKAAEKFAAEVRREEKTGEKFAATVRREEVTAETAGTAVLKGGPEEADWIAFFTADQPYLESGTIEAFIFAAVRSGRTLASVCCGQEPGSPTMFQRCWYPELLKIQGDRGGRLIMKRNPQEVFWYEISEREIMDIDYSC